MAATFTTTGEWMGTIRAAYETAQKVAGKPEPADGKLWRRRIYTIERHRFGKGVLAFSPNTGNTTTGDNLKITNGGGVLQGNAADTYLLLKDDIIPNPQGTDMWKEAQVAVNYQDWEEWEIP